MSQASTEIVRISGHAGTVPGAGLNREFRVSASWWTRPRASAAKRAKWRAWNGTDTRSAKPRFDNSYQTMPETAWNYWNLIKFNEHEREDGSMHAADAQRSVHALRGSGMPGGVSGGRGDRAVRERNRGFSGSALHRLRILHDRLPVQHSEIQSGGAKGFQMHFVQRPRVGGARTGVHQGVPDGLPAFRDEVGNEGTGGDAGGAAAHAVRIRGCGSLRSSGSGRNARDLRAARREESGAVWRTAEESAHSVFGAFVEGPLKWLGNLAMVGGLVGLALHYLRFGPKKEEPIPPDDRRPL